MIGDQLFDKGSTQFDIRCHFHQGELNCLGFSKGLAGNIGALGVQGAAESLELACKAGAEPIDKPLATVVAELQPVMAGLETLGAPPQGDDTAASTAVDKAVVEPLLRELHALVAQDDVDAADAVERLEPVLNNTPYAEYLEKVARAIDGYDFDAALEALERLVGELEINL